VTTTPAARVIVDVDPDLTESAAVVLSGAVELALAVPGVELGLVVKGVTEMTHEVGDAMGRILRELFGVSDLPDIFVYGETEAAALASVARVGMSTDPTENARALLALAAAVLAPGAVLAQPAPSTHAAEQTSEAGETMSRSLEEVFAQIYASGVWTVVEENSESRSGPGSNLAQTTALRAELPLLLAELEVTSILDAPCGDFFWMSKADLGVDTYIGADILPSVVEHNRQRFARSDREFRVLDLTTDRLPRVDLVFSRDCLVHLSDDDIHRALKNIRGSGITYLATTTFTNRPENPADIVAGGWRPLNLQRPPFSLPEPYRLINERCTEVCFTLQDGVNVEHRFTDKSIAVWRIADL
jgi:hypothetical protein